MSTEHSSVIALARRFGPSQDRRQPTIASMPVRPPQVCGLALLTGLLSLCFVALLLFTADDLLAPDTGPGDHQGIPSDGRRLGGGHWHDGNEDGDWGPGTWGTATWTTIGVTSGDYLLYLIVGGIFAYIYYTNVVKKIPDIRNMPRYNSDFHHRLFDCFGDHQTCLHVCYCMQCRVAHTWDVAGTMEYWHGLMVQCIICTYCWCCCGPCCLYTYMRMEMKKHFGLRMSFMDCLYVFFCLPCASGQMAMEIDDLSGADVSCCCTVRLRGGAPGPGRRVSDNI